MSNTMCAKLNHLTSIFAGLYMGMPGCGDSSPAFRRPWLLQHHQHISLKQLCLEITYP